MSYLLMIVGALLIGGQRWIWALALIGVSWLMRVAGGTAYRRALVARLLSQLTAADVLVRPRRTIAPQLSLRAFTMTLRGRTGHRPLPVIAGEMFVGMIGWDQLRDVPQGYWETHTVAETMIPAAELDAVTPTTPLSLLIPRLVGGVPGRRPALPVVQDGQLLGIVDAEQMLAILDLEDEFGLFARERAARPPISAPATAADAAPGMLEARERAVGR